MSNARDHFSDLTKDDSRVDRSAPSEFADSLSHTSSYFETWLEDLKPAVEPSQNPGPHEFVVENKQPPGDFRFEGNLRIDGYVRGQIRSLTGTLTLGEGAQVESDIVVAAAIIDGSLRGDIRASERVELLSHARVTGNIESPAIAIHPGAFFEGECHYLQPSFISTDANDEKHLEPISLAPGPSHVLDKSSAKIETA